MTPSERFARALLRLFPRRFRDEHGAEFLAHAEASGLEPRHRGARGRLRWAAFLVLDVLRAQPRVRRSHGPHGGGVREGTMTDGVQDLRIAARTFARRPGFFLVATLTLALGVGATTTMFSVADAVALRPLPYEAPERLVVLGDASRRNGVGSMTPLDFFDWQAGARTLDGAAASRLERHVLLGQGEPAEVDGAGVSGGFFELLGVSPVLGRTFGPDEDRPGAPPVAVVSHGFWTRHLGGDPAALGRTLALGERRFTVVGVLPPSFVPPEALYQTGTQIWYPLAHVDDDLRQRDAGFLQGLARLRPDVPVEAAQADLDRVADAVQARLPSREVARPRVVPLRDHTVAAAGSTLVLLMGAVSMLLLIACANVANLFLVRATERTREMAVRGALGGSRRRLVRQLLTESLLLAGIGGAVGCLLAVGGVAAFRATNPGDLPRLAEVAVDARVLAFATVLSLLTGLLFGLVPALRADPGRAAAALRGGPSTAGRRRGFTRGALVVGQTALAMVLLAGAGVLVHSFANLSRVDPGFEPSGAAWLQLRIPPERYPEPALRAAFLEDVERRLAGLPGVRAVGATENIPLGANASWTWVSPEGLELDAAQAPPDVSSHRVTPGFFEALGVELRAGRAFRKADGPDAEPVVVVNETLARRFWPDADAVGQRMRFGRPDGDRPWMRVVGVVADVHQEGLDRTTAGELYVPWYQAPRTNLFVVIRTAGDPTVVLPAARAQIWAVDGRIPLERFGTLEAHVDASLVTPRFYTLLMGSFAGMAVVLALVGLYGTLSFTVEQRVHELGVRMALGADGRAVRRMVVARGLGLVGLGLALGLAGAAAAAGALERFVFGIPPRDPGTLAVAALAMLVAALLACWFPARRATRVDPVRALSGD